MKKRLTWKRIGTDAAGVFLILLVPFLGPLPGPGGIPLLLTGLGLLSIHNDWAKRLLHYVRKNSEHLRDAFFPDKPLFQWGWDLLALALVVTGTLLNLYTDGFILKGFAVGLYALASTFFLFNRHRLRWFEKQIKRLRK